MSLSNVSHWDILFKVQMSKIFVFLFFLISFTIIKVFVEKKFYILNFKNVFELIEIYLFHFKISNVLKIESDHFNYNLDGSNEKSWRKYENPFYGIWGAMFWIMGRKLDSSIKSLGCSRKQYRPGWSTTLNSINSGEILRNSS